MKLIDHYCGWRRDSLDHRDHFRAVRPTFGLPKLVDLRPHCPPVYDQGQLGSCTANAIAAAFDFERKRQGLDFVGPSRLFVYYNEREMEGTVGYDAGAELRDGIKSVAKQGVCPETEWPYDISRFRETPSIECYDTALKDRSVEYGRIDQSLDQIRATLAAGYPFVFGISIFPSFESEEVAKTGIVPMPEPNEKPLGGHALMAAGYDDSRGAALIRNSWGTGWGASGYFWLPYSYLTNANLAADFWDIKLVKAS